MTNTSKGIIFLILSAFSFAAMALFVRLAGDINFIQKAFFRNAVSLIIALGFLIREGREKGWDSVAIPKGASFFFLFGLRRALSGFLGTSMQ